MGTYNQICVFDFETGGANPNECEITQIGACIINRWDLKIIDTFESMARPENLDRVEQGALEVTGFTLEQLELFVKHFYRVLKPGGTCIVFFDLWKITPLKQQLESAKFKQIRFIEWLKTNPQPINSKVNYLTNCREIALLGIKKSKPTFNSSYDKGVYEYPIQGGKDRFHPTQKNTKMFEDLILKHSNEGDVVLDCFLGSGTTAVAAKNTKRDFIGCELDKEYFDKLMLRLNRD